MSRYSRVKRNSFVLVVVVLFFTGCKKEKIVEPCNETVQDNRDQFVGNWNVYDTSGTFLYPISILKSGVEGQDSLLIQNFADTLDLGFTHQRYYTGSYLSFGVHHPVFDYNGKSWHVSSLVDDSLTVEPENTLYNDTIVFYFKQTNIAFYISESVSFFSCECKHIAVKQ